jgi:hypothetical protein
MIVHQEQDLIPMLEYWQASPLFCER